MTRDCQGARLDRPQLLVTGAAGLTGAALCDELAATHAVHAVSRRPRPVALAPDICWHQSDLREPTFAAQLPRRVDAVAHLAQSPRFREFPDGVPDVFAVNVAAVAHLLHWAVGAGVSHFVLASTGSIYQPSSQPLHESDPVSLERVSGFYAASKLASEVLALPFAGAFAVTALRPFFVYGPAQEPSMLIPRLVRSIRDGVPVRVAGGAGFRFTPTHVSDAVRAVVAALGLDGRHTVNVGGPDVLTLRAAAEAIGAAIGVPPVFEETDDPAGDLVPDLTLMRELLGPPTTRFSDGIAGM